MVPALQMPGRAGEAPLSARGPAGPAALEVDDDDEDEDSEQERSISSENVDPDCSTRGRRPPVAEARGGGHSQGRAAANVQRNTGGTSSAPARTFKDQSDSDFSAQGAPDGRGGRRDGGGGQGGGPHGDDEAMHGGSYKRSAASWHETLTQFPSLLRLYPMADSSEFEGGGDGDVGEDELNGMPPKASDDEETAEARCQSTKNDNKADTAEGQAAAGTEPEQQPASQPGWRSPGAQSASTGQSSPTTQSSPLARTAMLGAQAEMMAETAATVATRHIPSAQEQARYMQAMQGGGGAPYGGGSSAPCTPAGRGRTQVTPHSMPVAAWPRSARSSGAAYAGDNSRRAPNSDLAAAWAEVEQVRQSLLQRERELSQREAKVWREEARNASAAKQLGELRHRLDDYSAELEQGVATLTAQQQAAREERRQTLEMQARVRRMCAAAVRDDVVASKAQDWNRAWTPTQRGGS